MSNNAKIFEISSKNINENSTDNTSGNTNLCGGAEPDKNIEKKCLECDAYNCEVREEWYERRLSKDGLYFKYTDNNGKEGSVRIFEYTFPMLKDITNRTEAEDDVLSKMLDTVNSSRLNDNIDIYKAAYDEYNNIYEAEKVLKGVPVIVKNGYRVHTDYSSEKVNVINNRRFTTDVPDKYDNTIYIFGKSGVYGYGVEDRDTIASCIQRLINEKCSKRIRVVNCGVAAISDGEIRHNIQGIDYKQGDIIINIVLKRRCYDEENKGCNLSGRYTDLLTLFNEKDNRRTMFVDSVPHLNGRGNELIADKIFSDILQYISEEEENTVKNSLEKPAENLSEAVHDELRTNGRTGAIVMNCNPFTLGHRYLIETAKKQVDNLYVFVVEEDKSIFPFKDRIEMVKRGTQDLENVIVLPSGQFMISSLTFPEYFKKETEKNVVIDSSLDLQLFGEKIAKKYNISIRFAGEEPNDPITRQYNRNMEEILPGYGIEFREIKRAAAEGEVISATTVRKCLKNRDYDRLKRLVPETTYSWLEEGGYIAVNILITSIGRRVELIEHLKKTFAVIGADASENNAAKYFTDKFVVIPKCSEPDYADELLKVCVDNKVKMIVPLYEKEFEILCGNRQLFEDKGIKILLSDIEIINICNDKMRTQEFFRRKNICSPKLTDCAPAVIKPVEGMGSKGVYSVDTDEELEAAKVLLHDDYIIQEKIEGKEFTIDVLCDFEGNAVSVVPRERTEVRSGEVSKSKTVKNQNIIDETIRLIKSLNDYGKVIGPITVQCFVKKGGEIVFLEINPRFGGGVPLTFEAGINYGELLMKFLNGYVHKETPLDFCQVSMVRYDRAVYERET